MKVSKQVISNLSRAQDTALHVCIVLVMILAIFLFILVCKGKRTPDRKIYTIENSITN